MDYRRRLGLGELFQGTGGWGECVPPPGRTPGEARAITAKRIRCVPFDFPARPFLRTFTLGLSQAFSRAVRARRLLVSEANHNFLRLAAHRDGFSTACDGFFTPWLAGNRGDIRLHRLFEAELKHQGSHLELVAVDEGSLADQALAINERPVTAAQVTDQHLVRQDAQETVLPADHVAVGPDMTFVAPAEEVLSAAGKQHPLAFGLSLDHEQVDVRPTHIRPGSFVRSWWAMRTGLVQVLGARAASRSRLRSRARASLCDLARFKVRDLGRLPRALSTFRASTTPSSAN